MSKRLPHPRRRRRRRQARPSARRPQRADRKRHGDRHDAHRARRCRRSTRSPTRAARSSCSPISAGPRAGRTRRIRCRPVAAAVAEIVKRPVAFATDCIGEVAAEAIAAMKNGDILLLENTRFHKGEEKNDPAFVAELAKLGDIYVNDAFSAAHRAHASTEGLAHKLPAYCRPRDAGGARGADAWRSGTPERPVAAIVGGAKVSTKLELLGNLVKQGRRPDHRRRHGQHLPVRAGQGGRQVAVREGPGRHGARRSSRRPRPPSAASCCRSTRSSPRSSRRTRRRASSTSIMSPTTR